MKSGLAIMSAGLLAFGVASTMTPAWAQGSAQDLLTNALEALADQQPGEARSQFSKLLKAYPASPEAARARKELDQLDRDDGFEPTGQSGEPDDSEPQQAIPTDQALNGATARARRAFVIAVGDRVFFAENSAGIGGRARAMLESQARWLTGHPSLKIVLIGRADDGGSEEQARELSLQRAQAVRAKLIESGVPPASLSTEGRGMSDPVATCRSPLCQAQNRQVETLVSVVSVSAVVPKSIGPQVMPGAGGGTEVSAQSRDSTLAR